MPRFDVVDVMCKRRRALGVYIGRVEKKGRKKVAIRAMAYRLNSLAG